MTPHVGWEDSEAVGSPRPNWVIIRLQWPTLLTLVHTQTLSSARLGEVEYRDTRLGEVTAFYDWLRPEANRVVGVRFWPYYKDSISAAIEPFAALPNVSIGERQIWELFFHESHDYTPSLSADQDFGATRLLVSGAGEYALAFGIELREDDELVSITRLESYRAQED